MLLSIHAEFYPVTIYLPSCDAFQFDAFWDKIPITYHSQHTPHRLVLIDYLKTQGGLPADAVHQQQFLPTDLTGLHNQS
jgi:hypothetical protein